MKSSPIVSYKLMFMSLQVILASGYYAAFRVTLVAKALEGMYDGAIHITTDYEVGSLSCVILTAHTTVMTQCNTNCYFPQILTIPVKAIVAVGTLSSSPKNIILPPSFPVSKIPPFTAILFW